MGANRRTGIEAALERRILHGLACEWESNMGIYLKHEQQKRMRRPLFRLGEMKRKLGYWSGEKREICLNRDFVLNHSWDDIREVLRHEMAHQFTQDVLGVRHEKPHGPAFQQACKVLGADPAASGDYKTLHDRLHDQTPHPNDKIMRRVRKLMALAESRNQHEAEAAMIKAHELIARYNIDLMTRHENRNFVSVFIGKPALRRWREEYHLEHLLSEFYFVNGVWIPAYVIEKEKMGRVLEISGTPRNVNIAGYVYDFVMRFIDSQWKDYNRDGRLNRYRKTDFAVGVIEGFRSRLESEKVKEKAAGDERALIKIEDPMLVAYTRYRYPRLHKFSRNGASQDRDVLNDGMEAGKKMILHKGIAETGNSARQLPETI